MIPTKVGSVRGLKIKELSIPGPGRLAGGRGCQPLQAVYLTAACACGSTRPLLLRAITALAAAAAANAAVTATSPELGSSCRHCLPVHTVLSILSRMRLATRACPVQRSRWGLSVGDKDRTQPRRQGFKSPELYLLPKDGAIGPALAAAHPVCPIPRWRSRVVFVSWLIIKYLLHTPACSWSSLGTQDCCGLSIPHFPTAHSSEQDKKLR